MGLFVRAETRASTRQEHGLEHTDFFPVFNTQRPALFSTRPAVMDVAEATAFLKGTVLPLHEYTSPPFRMGLVRRVAWGLWSGLAPLAQGQYVLEIKASTGDGFWVDTTYHLDVTPF